MDEVLYFSWAQDKLLLPAIIGSFPKEGVSRGFFIPEDGSEWVKASGDQFADIVIEGILMEKTEFETNFGVIGKNVPELP